MLPQEFFYIEIRCSEITSEAKQSRSSYMAHLVLHPIFGCPYTHLLRQLTSNFHKKVLWLEEQQWGDRW